MTPTQPVTSVPRNYPAQLDAMNRHFTQMDDIPWPIEQCNTYPMQYERLLLTDVHQTTRFLEIWHGYPVYVHAAEEPTHAGSLGGRVYEPLGLESEPVTHRVARITLRGRTPLLAAETYYVPSRLPTDMGSLDNRLGIGQSLHDSAADVWRELLYWGRLATSGNLARRYLIHVNDRPAALIFEEILPTT